MLALHRTKAVAVVAILAIFALIFVGAAPALAQDNGKAKGHDKVKNVAAQKHENKGAHGNSSSAPGHNKGDKTNNGHHGNTGDHASHAGGNGKGHGHGNTGGNGNGHGNGGTKPENTTGHPGNNGTVKITPIGEDDGHPQNTPHVVCGFDIEWYGFDQGDYYSQVSLDPQAPTKDITISPSTDSVFVGEDPASGAGTATGLDAEKTYYPTFTGAPHPKQGYHVKLTIHTPYSQGSDVKHKVFWVQPCEEAPATENDDDTTTTPGDDTTTTTPEDTQGEVMGEQETNTNDDTEGQVMGEQETAPTENGQVMGEQATQGDQDARVPTAVDAGEKGANDGVFGTPVSGNALGGIVVFLLLAGGLVFAFTGRRRNA